VNHVEMWDKFPRDAPLPPLPPCGRRPQTAAWDKTAHAATPNRHCTLTDIGIAHKRGQLRGSTGEIGSSPKAATCVCAGCFALPITNFLEGGRGACGCQVRGVGHEVGRGRTVRVARVVHVTYWVPAGRAMGATACGPSSLANGGRERVGRWGREQKRWRPQTSVTLSGLQAKGHC